jgi:hypothetical protein
MMKRIKPKFLDIFKHDEIGCKGGGIDKGDKKNILILMGLSV